MSFFRFGHGIPPCVLSRKDPLNGLGGGRLGAVIQMGVNIAGGADVAVAQPFRNVLQSYKAGESISYKKPAPQTTLLRALPPRFC